MTAGSWLGTLRQSLRAGPPHPLVKAWVVDVGSPPGEHTRPAYPQKPLQELPGAVDVDAGDVAIPPSMPSTVAGTSFQYVLALE